MKAHSGRTNTFQSGFNRTNTPHHTHTLACVLECIHITMCVCMCVFRISKQNSIIRIQMFIFPVGVLISLWCVLRDVLRYICWWRKQYLLFVNVLLLRKRFSQYKETNRNRRKLTLGIDKEHGLTFTYRLWNLRVNTLVRSRLHTLDQVGPLYNIFRILPTTRHQYIRIYIKQIWMKGSTHIDFCYLGFVSNSLNVKKCTYLISSKYIPNTYIINF